MEAILTRQSPGNLHKALRLPGTYRIVRSVSGHDASGGYEGARWNELRMLQSPTAGTVVVFAQSIAGEPWQQINSDAWKITARRLLGL